MNKLNKEELNEVRWFLEQGQHRYRLLMELYNLSPMDMQEIVNNYFYAHSIGS